MNKQRRKLFNLINKLGKSATYFEYELQMTRLINDMGMRGTYWEFWKELIYKLTFDWMLTEEERGLTVGQQMDNYKYSIVEHIKTDDGIIFRNPRYGCMVDWRVGWTDYHATVVPFTDAVPFTMVQATPGKKQQSDTFLDDVSQSSDALGCMLMSLATQY